MVETETLLTTPGATSIRPRARLAMQNACEYFAGAENVHEGFPEILYILYVRLCREFYPTGPIALFRGGRSRMTFWQKQNDILFFRKCRTVGGLGEPVVQRYLRDEDLSAEA